MRKLTARFLPVFLILFLLDASLYAHNAAAQNQKTFMWKVQSKTSTIYVLGSVHFMKKRFIL